MDQFSLNIIKKKNQNKINIYCLENVLRIFFQYQTKNISIKLLRKWINILIKVMYSKQ